MFRYTTTLMAAAALVGSAAIANAQNTQQPPTRLPAAKITGDAMKAITVQNDRHTAVTLFVETGRTDRAIGTVEAGAVSTLEMPAWALRGQRNLKLVARAEGEGNDVAAYTLQVNDNRFLGLLVPPSAGLPSSDSILVTMPAGLGSATTVTIDNVRDQAVSVFAEQGLMFMKLGDVAANQQGTLALPASMLKNKNEIRVFARPDGAAQRSTQALRLKEGDHIAVIVM